MKKLTREEMSLMPFSNLWEEFRNPFRLFDRNWINLEDLLDTEPNSDQLIVYRPGRRSRRYRPYLDSRRGQGSSIVDSSKDKDKFKVTLDVNQFEPNEITVKTADNSIIVSAKHELKEDEHGFISRQFTRKYQIPNEYDIDKTETFLSSDGVLTITAPRHQDQILNERTIPIQLTGQPAVRQLQQQSQSMSNGSANTIENQDQLQNQEQNQKVSNTPQRGRRSTAKST